MKDCANIDYGTLYRKMSGARSKLSRALLECERAHFSLAQTWHGNGECFCAACGIKKSIELALAELEV